MIGTLAIAVFEIAVLAVGYMTARIVLPTLTFNKIKVDALSPGEAGFNWFGFKRLSDGALLCDATLAGWIGVLIWALVLMVVVALVTLRSAEIWQDHVRQLLQQAETARHAWA